MPLDGICLPVHNYHRISFFTSRPCSADIALSARHALTIRYIVRHRLRDLK